MSQSYAVDRPPRRTPPRDYTDQFALSLLDLIVQATQDPLGGAGVIVLNKLYMPPDSIFKNTLVETFEEKPSIVAKHARFEENNIGNS